jgi:hypothetical protein
MIWRRARRVCCSPNWVAADASGIASGYTAVRKLHGGPMPEGGRDASVRDSHTNVPGERSEQDLSQSG